jgi:hypothetical protein
VSWRLLCFSINFVLVARRRVARQSILIGQPTLTALRIFVAFALHVQAGSFDVQGDQSFEVQGGPAIILRSSWSRTHLTFKVVQQPFTLMSIDIRVTSLLKALFGAAGSLTVSAESSIYNCAKGVEFSTGTTGTNAII